MLEPGVIEHTTVDHRPLGGRSLGAVVFGGFVAAVVGCRVDVELISGGDLRDVQQVGQRCSRAVDRSCDRQCGARTACQRADAPDAGEGVVGADRGRDRTNKRNAARQIFGHLDVVGSVVSRRIAQGDGINDRVANRRVGVADGFFQAQVDQADVDVDRGVIVFGAAVVVWRRVAVGLLGT